MSNASSEWKPVLTAKSDSSDHTVSDVLTSELLRENPYKPRASSSTPERLEVQTDSSQLSMPVLSYYQYSSRAELPIPRNKQLPQSPPRNASSPRHNSASTGNSNMIDRRTHLQLHSGPLHQVPERFSQYIADPPKASGSQQLSSQYSDRRDISDSMGSQATIFSTRGDELNLRSKSKRKNRAMLGRRPTKAGPDYGEKRTQGLFRRSALRSKEGSMSYRMKLRLRKMAAKLRAMKHWPKRIHAFVTRKKATQRATMRRNSQKSSKSTGPATISAPLKNPQLGSEQGAAKVDGLTAELKHMAGHDVQEHSNPAPEIARVASPASKTSKDGKWSHLSKFISEQQELSSPGLLKPYNSNLAFSETSGPPPPPHIVSASLERQKIQVLWRRYLSNVLAQRIQIRQEITMFQALMAGQSVPSLLKGNPEVASSHNASIVKGGSERGTNSSHLGDPISRAASAASGKVLTQTIAESDISGDDDAVSLVSVSDSILSDNDIVSLPEEVSDWEEDPAVEKLHQTLNRRSVLGEMLDYESDDSSLETGSSVYLNLITQSATESAIIKRYGTLRRNRSKATTPAPTRSFLTPPATTSPKVADFTPERIIPRSSGIHCNLNEAN